MFVNIDFFHYKDIYKHKKICIIVSVKESIGNNPITPVELIKIKKHLSPYKHNSHILG